MDAILEVFGLLGASLVLLTMIIVTSQSGGGEATFLVIVGMLSWALPAIVGFIIIAAFGNMLTQLKAIREASERQNGLFQALLDRRTDA